MNTSLLGSSLFCRRYLFCFHHSALAELMAAYRREGEAMTKRENTIKMAESNKAFSVTPSSSPYSI